MPAGTIGSGRPLYNEKAYGGDEDDGDEWQRRRREGMKRMAAGRFGRRKVMTASGE